MAERYKNYLITLLMADGSRHKIPIAVPYGKDGKDGRDGRDGANGKDGKTPTIEISSDGYWVINGVKTEYKALGYDGKDGVDGADGKDGANGKDGADGKDGKDGSDYVLTAADRSEIASSVLAMIQSAEGVGF